MAKTELRIFRYQPDRGTNTYYEDFALEHDEGDGLTLLDAILRLQD